MPKATPKTKEQQGSKQAPVTSMAPVTSASPSTSSAGSSDVLNGAPPKPSKDTADHSSPEATSKTAEKSSSSAGVTRPAKSSKPAGRAPKFPYNLPYKSLDLRSNPELYRVGRGEEGVLSVEPYKSELLPHWRFKTPQLAEKSSETLLFRFHGYLAKDDFVGADMARKFVQMGYSRSLRYAYHKGGKKYQKVDGNEKIELPRDAEQDEEKAECARIFHAVLERMKADQRYQDLEAQHREKYDHQEIPSMSGDEVDVKEVEKAKTPKKVSLAQQRKRAAAEAEDSKTEAEERRPKGTFTAEAAQPKAKKARATVKEPIEPQRTSSRLRHKKDPA